MGFGITVAFFFISLLMPPSAGLSRTLPYFILGLWGGAFVFSISRQVIVASGIAYVTALVATLVTAAVIVSRPIPPLLVMTPFVICSIIPYFSRVGGVMDMLLTPAGYFGGLITGLLLAINVASGASDSIAVLIVPGVLGSIVSFFAVAFKFFMGKARQRAI